jgi:hypothetical protein
MEKYAARLSDENTVEQVIVGDPTWASERLGGTWVGSPSKIGVGWTYTEEEGFRSPQPYPSWVWGENGWEAPVAQPDDENFYEWDEESQSWLAVDLEEV